MHFTGGLVAALPPCAAQRHGGRVATPRGSAENRKEAEEVGVFPGETTAHNIEFGWINTTDEGIQSEAGEGDSYSLQ